MKFEDVIAAIRSRQFFSATLDDGSVTIRVCEYVPYLCTAVHAGHNMREDLEAYCLLNDAERLQEEDPYTDHLIASFPITLVAHDSRYEYDLNRDLASCIYTEAWGKEVWKNPLTDTIKNRAVKKHSVYYAILNELVSVIRSKFGSALLIDLHSYNWKIRSYEYAPIFNIGTKLVNVSRWSKVLKVLEKHLGQLELPNLDVTVDRNIVFQGSAYQAAYLKQHFKDVLVIPLEVKKIYMDELSGEVFPLVLEKLADGLFFSVVEAASYCMRSAGKNKIKKSDLHPSNLQPIVIDIDKALYRLAKCFETLNYVNPVNLLVEKKRFHSKKDYDPEFRYRQLRIDPYEFKERLYSLPVSKIHDPMIRDMYRAVINGYAMKVDMLTSIGTDQFLYNSLRYYGEPTQTDIENAHFLLHASQKMDAYKWMQSGSVLSVEEVAHRFEKAAHQMQLDCKVIISKRLAAKALVDNFKQVLKVNRYASITEIEAKALIHHELGVHMVTTKNALYQPLHILKLGLPGNTYTQEGLAILSEYLSGNLTLKRLRQLALRVLAVDMMSKGYSFRYVYWRLHEEYLLAQDDAFALVVRVFRGGGFTKDYLYLSGFRDMLIEKSKGDLSALLIGKTGVRFHSVLSELIDRGIFNPPRYLTPAFISERAHCDAVLDYLVMSIK